MSAAPADQAAGLTTELCLGRLDGFIAYHLRVAQDASFQTFARRVDKDDLKPGRFTLLVLISQNHGLTPTALSRASGRDKSSITPALHDLEQRGLIERCRVPTDGRSYTLTLTDLGRACLDEMMAHAEAHDRALDAIVGPRNKQRFIDQLRRITHLLNTDQGEP